jgi:hypothetical protein
MGPWESRQAVTIIVTFGFTLIFTIAEGGSIMPRLVSKLTVLACLGFAVFAGFGTDCRTAASTVAATQNPPAGWLYWGSHLTMEEARKAADSLEATG